MDKQRYKKAIARLNKMVEMNAPASIVGYFALLLCFEVYGGSSETIIQINDFERQNKVVFCFGCWDEFEQTNNEQYCERCKESMKKLLRDIRKEKS